MCKRKLLFGFVVLLLFLSLVTVGFSRVYSAGVHQASAYSVWVRIYRIQKIDDIENPVEGEADWNYEISLYDGKELVKQKDEAPSNNDDIVVNRDYRFDDVTVTSTTVYIHLWDSDLGGLTGEDADISSRAGYNYYKGFYNLESDTLTGDTVILDGSYYKTSGNFDGSTGTDENDANLWFKIWDNYTPESKAPIPKVSSSVPSVQVDVSSRFSVDFTVTNIGGPSSSDSYLTVSISHDLDIVSWSSTPSLSDLSFNIYEIGDLIWNNQNQQIQAEYVLLDVHGHPFESGESVVVTIVFESCSSQSLNEWVKYRVAMLPEGVNYPTETPTARDPTSSAENDQQGYPVYKIDVDIFHYAELTNKYFPHLMFDSKEKYYPCNFYYEDTNIDDNPKDYNLSWPLTCYTHVAGCNWNNRDYLVIEYWFYYVRDSKIWNVEAPYLGAHNHDWESVYVFIDRSDCSPKFITYFHHLKFGEDYYHTYQWMSTSFERIGNHPILYVARDSHASYGTVIFDGITYPIPEFCDGKFQFDLNEFKIIYVDEPNPSWLGLDFGKIEAPWDRERWNAPVHVLENMEKESGTSILMREAQCKLYLHLYDNQSRHVGVNYVTNETELEIPGSYYADFGNVTFVMLPSNITDFKIVVDAKYARLPVEEYQIVLTTIREGEVVDELNMTCTIERAIQEEFDARLDEEGYIMQIPEFSSVYLPLILLVIVSALTITISKKKQRRS